MSKMMLDETGREHEIATRLIAELLKQGPVRYDHVIVDKRTGNKYRITIKEVDQDLPTVVREHKTFIVAGPGGAQCRCCSGSGRE